MTKKLQSSTFDYATNSTSEIANDWLLPDGVHDILFADADKQNFLRHHLIKQLKLHGYQLVSPPFIEFTETLLANASEDLKRQTFRIVDRISGRLMGVRADTTPQILRIDASYGGEGISRYCYVGHTLHTLPTGLFGLRTPLQLGAEIFGSDSINADFELLDIICQLLDGLQLSATLHIDFGHVAIFKRLVELSNLSEENIEQLTQFYSKKALPELEYVCQNINYGDDFYQLALCGNNLEKLESALSDKVSSDAVIKNAFAELKSLQSYLIDNSQLQVSIDVSDLSGYQYHSGMLFKVYVNNASQPLIRGGRFNGNLTEQLRPAIGFSMDVTKLLPLFTFKDDVLSVLVNYQDLSNLTNKQKQQLNEMVKQLRAKDNRVVVPLDDNDKPTDVSHVLKLINDEWQLTAL